MAHGAGSKDEDNPLKIGVERVANQVFWLLTNPNPGSPFNPIP